MTNERQGYRYALPASNRSVYASDALWAKLEEQARCLGKTLNGLVVSILKQALGEPDETLIPRGKGDK